MNTVSIPFAYLDANSGTMLLQIVLGGLGGLFVFAKLFWHRIRTFFSRRGSPTAQEAAPQTDQLELPQQSQAEERQRAA